MRFIFSVLLTLVAITLPATLSAGTIYVNNVQGDDLLDGRAPVVISNSSGPVRSIRRALVIAQLADTIEVASNNGRPYYESISLSGKDHSGLPAAPFTLKSNGAVISGAKPLRPEDWKFVSPALWTFTPWRKGYYYLIQDGKPVPEFKIPPGGTKSLADIPEKQWAVWEGSIYYRSAIQELPDDFNLSFAGRDFGLSLVDVQHVRVEGFTFQHFRIDGVNAHTLVRDTQLIRIGAYENARAGVSVNKTSRVTIEDSAIGDNRIYQLLITGKAAASVENTPMSAPPKVIP